MTTAAEQLGTTLADKDDHYTVVVKSTVVPGSTEEEITPLLETAGDKTAGKGLRIGINLEFLHEGTAIDDFLHLDEIVLGADDDTARQVMQDVFEPLIADTGAPVVEPDTRRRR